MVSIFEKNSTCIFDFQRKIVIALLIEFMFYTTNVYCPLNIYYKEIQFYCAFVYIRSALIEQYDY